MHRILHGIETARTARELKLRVMDEVAAPFGAGATGLYLFGPDGAVRELHTRGVRDGFNLAYEQLGRGADPILERALATRAPAHDAAVFRGDAWERSALYRACGGPWKIRHYLCAPIVIGDQVVGTLNLGRRTAGARFGRREVARASALCRRIAARLQGFGRDPETSPGAARATIEELGRLSAERTQVRLHAAELEARAAPLDRDAAGELWDALAARHVTPLDYFDHGDRTYVLIAAPGPTPPARLTRREAQIVSRVAAGLATKVIAGELGISLHTVAAALGAARAKLGVRSRVQVVEMARRLGLAG